MAKITDDQKNQAKKWLDDWASLYRDGKLTHAYKDSKYVPPVELTTVDPRWNGYGRVTRILASAKFGHNMERLLLLVHYDKEPPSEFHWKETPNCMFPGSLKALGITPQDVCELAYRAFVRELAREVECEGR